MKLKAPPKVTQQDFPKPGEPFSQRFIQNYATHVRDTYNALNGSLTFSENINSVWLSASCPHDTEVAIANPLQNKAAPKQVLVFSNKTPIKSNVWSFDSANNQIDLTVNYDLDHTKPYISLRTALNTTVSNGSSTVLSWSGSPMTTDNTVLSWSNDNVFNASKIKVLKAGIYEFQAFTMFASSSAGGTLETYIMQNGSSANRIAEMRNASVLDKEK